MSYHHRELGVLGAAFHPHSKHPTQSFRAPVYTELIVDGIHVEDTLIRWTLELNRDHTIFVSDAAPAAATRGEWVSFDRMKCRMKDGASRLPNGALCGGGLLLPEAYLKWLKRESRFRQTSEHELFIKTSPSIHTLPLKAIGYSAHFLNTHKVHWKLKS
jgi:N-acetylglucosamine-6-phosphate deacetylase